MISQSLFRNISDNISGVFYQLEKYMSPLNGAEYWREFIHKSIEKYKKMDGSKWDSQFKRPSYMCHMIEDISDEMSIRIGQIVQVATIRELEQKAQGQIDYLSKFALYCNMYEKTNKRI